MIKVQMIGLTHKINAQKKLAYKVYKEEENDEIN